MGEREETMGAPSRRGRRLQTALFALAFLGIAAATAAGYLVAVDQERGKVDDRAAGTAAVAATATATIVRGAGDALGGASLLVGDDGEVDLADFETFAVDVASSGVAETVALIEIVDERERAAYEAANGEIVVATGNGGTVRAAIGLGTYYPVRAVYPAAEAFSQLNLDYGSDPARGPAIDAAVNEGITAATGRTILANTASPGVNILHPIYPSGARVGTEDPAALVATALTSDDLASGLAASLTRGTRFRVTDGATVVAASGQPAGRHVQTMAVEVPGGMWRVTIQPAVGPNLSVARAAIATGVAVGLGLIALFAVTSRHQRRLDRSNRSMGRAEARSRTLERLASQLSRSLSGAEVAGVVLESLPGLTGATGGAVTVLSADGEQLELLAASDDRHDDLRRLGRVTVEPGSTLAGAVASGEAIYLSSPLAWRGDEILTRFAQTSQAVAVIPLRADAVLGVLVVRQPGVRRFSDDERALLETVGALAGRALSRSLRYDAEHASSLAFQRASLPAALPATPGVTIAARYRPAAISAAVGGDWYDMLRLDDGRMAVVVGDVVGHGVPAAAAMGQLRTAVRVLASVVPDPVQLLRALSAHVTPIPDALAATMAYGVVEPATGRFDYIMAGHLPPLILRASGGSEFLEGPPWPPLGVAPKSPPPTQTAILRPGDTLVLYTDGVAERRGESLVIGLERLRTAAGALGDLPPEDLCDALLEAIVPAEDQADDVAMLVLQLEPVPTDEPSAPETVNGATESGRSIDPAALP